MFKNIEMFDLNLVTCPVCGLINRVCIVKDHQDEDVNKLYINTVYSSFCQHLTGIRKDKDLPISESIVLDFSMKVSTPFSDNNLRRPL
jgi:uncharacterized Zn finger protein